MASLSGSTASTSARYREAAGPNACIAARFCRAFSRDVLSPSTRSGSCRSLSSRPALNSARPPSVSNSLSTRREHTRRQSDGQIQVNEEMKRRGDAPGAERATSLLLRLTSKGTKNFGHVLGFREHRVSLRDGGVGVGEHTVVSGETRIRGGIPGQQSSNTSALDSSSSTSASESRAVPARDVQRLRSGVQGGVSGDARDARAV